MLNNRPIIYPRKFEQYANLVAAQNIEIAMLRRSLFRARADNWRALLVGLALGGCIGAVVWYLVGLP